jgi:1,4-dihydroxy-2-naphthoate octaprenyltransferase
VGCLATAIIVVNNLRDRHTDVHAGKRTMAVRFGGTFAKVEYFALVVGSYGFCIYVWLTGRRNTNLSTIETWTSLLPLLSFPMAIPQLKAVPFGGKDGQDLNVHVGGTAKVQVIYCLLLALGLAYR